MKIFVISLLLSVISLSTKDGNAPKYWTCDGPVYICTSPDHKGKEYKCDTAPLPHGTGDDETEARRAGAMDCEGKLETSESGSFYCQDASHMHCYDSDAN